MKTSKKLICFLCCFVVLFTCASVSWSPHVDAAMPVASYVASVVGSFILSAGFSFDNRGDFQSATEAFLHSDVARGITEITDHVGRICALGNMSEPLLIHELVQAGFFKDFWNSIYDFFGSGEIEVNTGLPTPSDGFAYYNGILLPFYTSDGYNFIDSWDYAIILDYTDNPTPYFEVLYSLKLNPYYKATSSNTSVVVNSHYYSRYFLTGNVFKYITNRTNSGYNYDWSRLVWSKTDIKDSSGNLMFAGSLPVTEGQENIDVIGVYNNEVHTAEDIIASWARTSENGGAIDWALDSIPAYQDITSSDKDVPVTQTQSGVLTQSGVKVQTDEEVKEEVKQEAIKELGNYTVTGLASIFPFCIPFDIYNFFAVLTAEREAPVFDFPLNFGKLGSHHVHVDLSGWDTVAQILRTIELLAFCVALAWGTSKLIKW